MLIEKHSHYLLLLLSYSTLLVNYILAEVFLS